MEKHTIMEQKKPLIIGSRTLVDFPDLGFSHVPAKIDTGADSSSIWATNIVKDKDGLSFKLFGPSSPNYNGEIIHTKEYSIRSVKNSFGVSEFRYKVPLAIKLRGRKINARFTLADRQYNRYPILIGRQTLKHKFIVDVSRTHGNNPIRTLVLVHTGNEKTLEHFAQLNEKFEGRLDVNVVRYKDLMMVADVEDVRLSVRSANQDVASYDFIFFLTRTKNAELAAMVAAYAKQRGVTFADQAAVMLATDTKAHQALMLAARNISLPRTMYMHRDGWEASYNEIKNTVGLPFIFKDNNGRKGRNNFLIKSKKDFSEKCAFVHEHQLQMVAQTFIPNTGYYRIVVMGGLPVVAMYRKIQTNHSHLFDRERTGPAKMVDLKNLPSEAQQLAIRAAELLSLDVAGVDVLQDKHTGLWYCLEVNNSPQLVGGAFVEEKMRALGAFFIREPGR
jgi:glutathione synthase/RimK-type ligase-like ATP-grasp enzyme